MMVADSVNELTRIDAKSTQGQALLESAKNQSKIASQMLMTAKDNYVKTTDLLSEQQNKIGEIQANISRLTTSESTLVSVL